MQSFKLEKGGSSKQQALGAGALLLILAIVCFVLVGAVVAFVLGALSVVLMLGGAFATETTKKGGESD